MSDDQPYTEVRYDEDAEAYVALLDLSGTTEPSVQIVSVIASITGRDPEELAVLRKTVDPGALDRLLLEGETRAGSLRISFDYLDYVVTVTGTGELRVEDGADS